LCAGGGAHGAFPGAGFWGDDLGVGL